jgi:hypothetical protein
MEDISIGDEFRPRDNAAVYTFKLAKVVAFLENGDPVLRVVEPGGALGSIRPQGSLFSRHPRTLLENYCKVERPTFFQVGKSYKMEGRESRYDILDLFVASEKSGRSFDQAMALVTSPGGSKHYAFLSGYDFDHSTEL